mgnify:FL=1
MVSVVEGILPGAAYGRLQPRTVKIDGVLWYNLDCRYQFGDWIERQDPTLWQVLGERHRAHYAVSEQLMTVILLRGNEKKLYE